MEKVSEQEFKELIKRFDNVFPWFFVSSVLYLSSFSGSIVTLLTVFDYNYESTFLVALIIALVLAFSLPHMMLLISLYRNRNKLYNVLINYKQNNMMGQNTLNYNHNIDIKSPEYLIYKIKRDLSRYPIYLYFSFIGLIIGSLYIIILRRYIGWW